MLIFNPFLTHLIIFKLNEACSIIGKLFVKFQRIGMSHSFHNCDSFFMMFVPA